MKLDSIQALRGLAASFVVLGHSSGFGIIKLPGWFGGLGYSGVDLFFVISGFIICQVVRRINTTPIGFLRKRLWRVYSLYWVVLAFSFMLNRYGISNTPEWMQNYFHPYEYILLLKTENRFIPPAWTLCYELYFYCVVSLLLFFPRKYFYKILTGWMVFQAALSATYGNDAGPVSNILVIEFGLGCFVAWLAQAGHLHIRLGYIALFMGIACFSAGDYVSLSPAGPSYLGRFFTFGVAGAFLVYAFVTFEKFNVCAFPRFITAVGDASYSLYLWHWPLIAVGLFLGVHGGLYVIIIYVVALTSFQFIERPLLKMGAAKSSSAVGFVS